VHENWKQAIIDAHETDTVMLSRQQAPALRALRTEKTNAMEFAATQEHPMAEFARAKDLYFGGDLEASIALTGQVCGRIDKVLPVADIIAGVRDEFFNALQQLNAQYLQG
jgi:enoyl-[acyl-carrier protein] reductase II